MFSGIIQTTGIAESLYYSDQNLILWVHCPFVDELRIDQSIAHNGVCLTVDALKADTYRVTIIQETLRRTNLGSLKQGGIINLERSLSLNTLLDGHLVQGHVDTTAVCVEKQIEGGSYIFTFQFTGAYAHLLVEKGSVAVNGVSLTLVNCENDLFSVAIIPYTHEHTNFSLIEKGSSVNIEFDVIGKYIARMAGFNKL